MQVANSSSNLHYLLDVLPESDVLVQVQQLVDMGFPYGTVSRALLAAGGDQNAALERLLG